MGFRVFRGFRGFRGFRVVLGFRGFGAPRAESLAVWALGFSGFARGGWIAKGSIVVPFWGAYI